MTIGQMERRPLSSHSDRFENGTVPSGGFSPCSAHGSRTISGWPFAMDVLAHALWTAPAAIAARQRFRHPIHLRWAVFWGVFPDLFSFAVPAVIRIWWYATGVAASLLPDAKSAQRLQFVWRLYYGSHSLVMFAVVFGVVWVLARRPVLELLGWGLHILIDIPTHQGIFAVPFLWPLSSFAIYGIRSESYWFVATNYGALLLLFSWMRVRKRRLRNEQTLRNSMTR
jgi:hypothetical protein